MAVILSNEAKYSFGYTANRGGELSSRTIAGLNISSTISEPEVGPTIVTVVNCFKMMFDYLSTAEITNGRWITEKAVTF